MPIPTFDRGKGDSYLEKVGSQTEILHINSLKNINVIEMSLNEKIKWECYIIVIINLYDILYVENVSIPSHHGCLMCCRIHEMIN